VACGFNLVTRKAVAIEQAKDLRHGSHEEKHAPMATTERGPLFSLLGIEFTIAKTVVLSVVLITVLGGLFGIVLPAQKASEDYTKLTDKIEGPLRKLTINTYKKDGAKDLTVTEIYWVEEVFMLSLPDKISFRAPVVGKANGMMVDKIRGEYFHKTGDVILIIPNNALDGYNQVELKLELPKR